MIVFSILLLSTTHFIQSTTSQRASSPQNAPATRNTLESRFLSLGRSSRAPSFSTTPAYTRPHELHDKVVHAQLFHAVEHCSQHGCQLTVDIECDGGKTAPQVVKVAPLHERGHQRHFLPEHQGRYSPEHHGRESGDLLPPWIAQQRRGAQQRHPSQDYARGRPQEHGHHPTHKSCEEECGREGLGGSPFSHRQSRPSLYSKPQFAQTYFPSHSKSKHEHLWLGDEEDYHKRKQSHPKRSDYFEEEEHRHRGARHPSSRRLGGFEEEWPKHGKHQHEKEGHKPRHFFESSEEEQERREVPHRHRKPKHHAESPEYEEERREVPRQHKRGKFLEEEEEQRPYYKHRRFQSEEDEEPERHRQRRSHKRFDPDHVMTRDKQGNVVFEPRHEQQTTPHYGQKDKDKKHHVTFPDGNIAIIHATDLKDPKWWREAQKKLGKKWYHHHQSYHHWY